MCRSTYRQQISLPVSFLKRKICLFVFQIQIYSVNNGVANVFISTHDRTVQQILIDEGFARTADENFMSKEDHDMRIRPQTTNNIDFEEECDVVEEEMRRMLPMDDAPEVEEPELSKRHIHVTLKGPNSPLESRIYGCMHQTRSQSKQIVIENSSVNSVLLEANPQVLFSGS